MYLRRLRSRQRLGLDPSRLCGSTVTESRSAEGRMKVFASLGVAVVIISFALIIIALCAAFWRVKGWARWLGSL